MFGKILLLLAVIGAGLFWNCCNKVPKYEVPSEKIWWGPQGKKEDSTVRKFTINISEKVIEDLNQRLAKTRLASPLEGINFQYGFNTDTLQKIVKFWQTEYKWKEREVYLNKYPQFKTQIQGLDIHYIHVKPKLSAGSQKKVIPLMLLHGWPGSVREFYEIIPYFTTERKDVDFVFEVIAPSLPGYGFSDPAVNPGLGPGQIAVIFNQLMLRLGHSKYYLQGGDWGSQVASHMGLFYPENVQGLHLNMCTSGSMKSRMFVLLGAIYPQMVVDAEDVDKLYPYWEKFGELLLETGYLHIQATKPDTVGVGLSDSPAGLAAYILEKFSTGTLRKYREVKDGGLLEKFSYNDLLDNVMIYWVTNSMTSAMRIYAENFAKEHRALNLDTAQVTPPTWCSKFSNELGWLPDWILKSTRYPNLVKSVNHKFGGHFAAFENPKTLSEDVWNAFIEGEQLLAAKAASAKAEL